MLLHNRSTTPRSLPHTSCMLFLALARRSLGVQFPWLKKKAVFDSLTSVLTGIEGYTNILPVCLLHHAAVTAAYLLYAFPRTCSAFPWGSIPVIYKKKTAMQSWLRFLRELKVTQTYFLYVCSTTPRSLPQTSCLLFLVLARRSLGVQFPWLNF